MPKDPTIPNYDSMVLDMAGDDYTGLWELVWGAGARETERNPEELIAELRSAVQRLVDRGALGLFRGTFFNGDEQPAAQSEACAILTSADGWKPPEGDVEHVRVLIKENG